MSSDTKLLNKGDLVSLVKDLERHGGREKAVFRVICNEDPELYGSHTGSRDNGRRRKFQQKLQDVKRWTKRRYWDFLRTNNIEPGKETLR